MTVAKPQTDSKRQVLLYPGEDGYFIAEVPSLPGCISQGKTREEALRNIEEAIGRFVAINTIKMRQFKSELTNDRLFVRD